LIFLALFFFPIALYCLILGMINRRVHPVMVSGSWDFFGLLLAASGLILFGGPTLLAIYYDRDVRDFLLGNYRFVNIHFTTLFLKWWLFWLLYYVIVLGGGALLVWSRRAVTSIYNVEPLIFDDNLALALDRTGVEWTRMGNRVFIGFRDRAGRGSLPQPQHSLPGPYHAEIIPGSVVPRVDQPLLEAMRPEQGAVLDIEPFFTTRHVTLYWRNATLTVRQQVESELGRVLAEVHTHDNPAGTWLMIIASSLFAIIFFGVALFILIHIRMNKPL
jgi:hypothetical protein